MVDLLAKYELNQLNRVKNNQKELCVELYSGGFKFMKHDSNKFPKKVGECVILPLSVIGSDRYMHQEYINSILMWQKVGHANGFLTYAFNPNYREIKENLR